jgi:signal transduction histidine kinase
MKLTRRTQDSHWPSTRTAIIGALGIPFVYILVATAYILFSGHVAAMFAQDAKELAAIESIKGFVFVLVTGSLLFVLCFLWRRKMQRQTMLLVQSEKDSVVAMASASVAHDLNNLLMALSGLLEGLEDQEQGNEFLITMRKGLQVGIDELSQLSKSLVQTARQLEPNEKQEIELSERLLAIVRLLKKHPDVQKCKLKADHICPVRIYMNATLFEQVVLNLVINAAQAAGPNGVVELSLRQRDGTVVLQVDDNGPGINPMEYERIFSPGYTTKDNGSGLGLLCVRAFADSCNARISIERSKLGGAAFLIQIPAKESGK